MWYGCAIAALALVIMIVLDDNALSQGVSIAEISVACKIVGKSSPLKGWLNIYANLYDSGFELSILRGLLIGGSPK